VKKIYQIAMRDFVATVSTKAFIIGLLVVPAILVVAIVVGPRVFNLRNFQVRGEIAIIDPTGQVTPELKALLDPQKLAARRANDAKQALAQAPPSVREAAAAAPVIVPELTVIERPANADIQMEKA
jgi:hypothetical protein